jgi:uncharacterized membrane-anchored protein YitT (DUF2179 family)
MKRMKQKKEKKSGRIKKLLSGIKPARFPLLALAGIINAFGVTIFLYPVDLYDSGASGTAMLLAQITPDALSLSVFLLVLNIPLFLIGFKKQGAAFTVYSLFAVCVYSAASFLITDVLPVDVSMASPLAGTDLLLCAMFGGLISGAGSGLTIRFGGAIDGAEIMAVIFSERLGVSVGTLMMAYNTLLYIVCGVVLKSWILPLYSIVTYAVGVKTIDFIVEGLDRSKAAVIVTVKPDEICSALSSAFRSGITRLAARGGFSNEEKTMIYFVVNRFQIGKLKEIVHSIDPTAYITISDIADIYKTNREE